MTAVLEALTRVYAPLALALLAALAVDAGSRRRGLDPPLFAVGLVGSPRRLTVLVLLTLVFWVGIFGPLGTVDAPVQIDVTSLRVPQLFAVHAMLVVTLVAWYLLGFGGGHGVTSPLGAGTQLGLRAPAVAREIGIGVALGAGIWALVLAILMAIGLTLLAAGRGDVLPSAPPAFVPWLAAQSIGLRFLISLSAGVVEETFFRGFLQPRVGLLLSTVLFALAHLSYGEPFLLVGVTLLSLIYGLIVRWRQNIWAAIAAHTLFDAVQLLVLIPIALRSMEEARKAAGG